MVNQRLLAQSKKAPVSRGFLFSSPQAEAFSFSRSEGDQGA